MKEIHRTTDSFWPGVSDIWLTTQTILTDVYRWSRYNRSPIRLQNDLQHSYSVTILAKVMMEMISPYHPGLDKELILSAFLVHDHGEGELKRDICYGDKADHEDVKEYLAFRTRYEQLDTNVFSSLERAYLLQHCLKDRSDFPEQAATVMSELKKYKYFEALTFGAIEIWDYLLYAMEQDREGRDPVILHQVTGNHIQQLETLAEKLPGFRETIWTEKVAAHFADLLN